MYINACYTEESDSVGVNVMLVKFDKVSHYQATLQINLDVIKVNYINPCE